MIELSNTNVVVVTNELSTVRFNPEFLLSLGIAKDDWQVVEEPITTPVFSLVKYSNNYHFIVEGNKIQVTFAKHGHSIEETKGSEYLTKIISSSFQPYIAVGINAFVFIPHEEPNNFLLEKFFNQNTWLTKDLKGAAITLAYQVEKFLLRLNLEAGQHKTDLKTRSGIVINANFHLDIQQSISVQESKQIAIDLINEAPNLYSSLYSLLTVIFPS